MNRRDFAITLATGTLVVAGCISAGSNRAGNSDGQIEDSAGKYPFAINTTKPDGTFPQNGHQLSAPTIEFDSAKRQVLVTGYMEIGDSCKTVELKQVVYEPETATLVVTIADAMRDDIGNKSTGVVSCTNTTRMMGYGWTFTFQTALPETVTIHVNDVYDQELTVTANK